MKIQGKKYCFFVSDRVGGLGGKDIWYAYLDEEGQPSKPINLKAINTAKDDLSPFFHNYTQTLYFSSEGRKSLGGLDIYKTVKIKEKWTEVNHTGFPLNSSYNDVYFSLNQNGSEGFLSSNREGTLFLDKQISACCYDIFKAEFNSFIIDLKVLTFEEVNGQKIDLEGASVTVYELFDEAEKEIKYKINPEKNQHFFRINSNKKYRIEAKKLGLVTATLAFNTDNSIPDKEIIKELVLKKPELQILTFNQNLETTLEGATVRLNELDNNGKVIAEIPLKKSLENSYYYPIDFFQKL